MSENAENARTPDNITEMVIDGCTYEIREFMGGNADLNDVVTRRIQRDLDPNLSIGQKGEKA